MANESSEISLVDVLTNAFIVSMILMCIVATTMGDSGKDMIQRIVTETGLGEIPTSALTKKKKKEKDPPTLTLSLVLPAHETVINLLLGATGNTTLSESNLSISKGAYQQTHWLVIRTTDSLSGHWNVVIKGGRFVQHDSVTVLLTIGTKPLIKRILYRPEHPDFIQVNEPAKSGDDVFVYGVNLTNYPD